MSLLLNGLLVGVVQFQFRHLVSSGLRSMLRQWSDGELIGRRR